LNGQVLRGQSADGEDVRGLRAHDNAIFLVSLVRHMVVKKNQLNLCRAIKALLLPGAFTT